MSKLSSSLLIIMAFIACQSGTEISYDGVDYFDSDKWKLQVGRDYPYRDTLLTFLIKDQKWRALNTKGILDLLGEPSRSNEAFLYYTIKQKRLASWPLHTKSLVIKMSEDDDVEWMKIHE